MENLEFFSEGFWVCAGALIGATIGGVITYIISCQTQKLELKKQKVEYLMTFIASLNLALIDLKKIDEYLQYDKQVVDFMGFVSRSKYLLDSYSMSRAIELENIIYEQRDEHFGYDKSTVEASELLKLFIDSLSSQLIKKTDEINKLLNV